MPATLTEPKLTEINKMIPIHIYDSLTQQKEEFRPVVPGKVGIYLCGPTVYKEAHIGHLVGPIIFDAVKRFLTYCGYDVTWYVNITDVDDKLIAQSQERNISMSQIATEMTMDYCANLLAVGVDQISSMPRATDHMRDIIAMIENLIKKDYAYDVEGDVFFDVLSDDEYGKLNNRSAVDQQGEGGEAAAKKRSTGDFALWKSAKPGEPSWNSPWGKGRPGWHIECSAMSKRLLGETMDIHGGGLDLKFPHHENEIAQSECFDGKPMAKYWMHNGLLRAGTAGKVGGRADHQDGRETPEQVEAGKMSRSKGAGGLRGLIERQGGERLRFFLLRTHYRSTVVFSEQAVTEESKSLDRFYQFFDRYQRISGQSFYPQPDEDRTVAVDGQVLADAAKIRAAFLEKMADDFNTGAAVGELFQLLTALNKFADVKQLDDPKHRGQEDVDQFLVSVEVLRELAEILGLFRKAPSKMDDDDEFTRRFAKVIYTRRAEARAKKDFATADLMRDIAREMGFDTEDRKNETVFKPNQDAPSNQMGTYFVTPAGVKKA